jgi:hypothetical protein
VVVNVTFDGAIAVTPVAPATTTADVNAPANGFLGLLVAAEGTLSFTDAQGNVVDLSDSGPPGSVIRVRAVNVINSSTATAYCVVGVS